MRRRQRETNVNHHGGSTQTVDNFHEDKAQTVWHVDVIKKVRSNFANVKSTKTTFLAGLREEDKKVRRLQEGQTRSYITSTPCIHISKKQGSDAD